MHHQLVQAGTPGRTSPAPTLTGEQLQQKLEDAAPVAERLGIESLPPDGGDGQ